MSKCRAIAPQELRDWQATMRGFTAITSHGCSLYFRAKKLGLKFERDPVNPRAINVVYPDDLPAWLRLDMSRTLEMHRGAVMPIVAIAMEAP